MLSSWVQVWDFRDLHEPERSPEKVGRGQRSEIRALGEATRTLDGRCRYTQHLIGQAQERLGKPRISLVSLKGSDF